jgi:histidinol-phosphate/aromatic aminotransferase/cobyric acid decarboxylase-like protein
MRTATARRSDPFSGCYHGGAFFEAIGDDFATLDRAADVINADVLDAWFPPTPRALSALHRHLPWLLRTSPPTACAGFVRAVAQARGVDAANVLPGAGSSALLFLAFRHWLTPSSRVLLLEPTYGEYAHVLEHVIGCRVDRFALSADHDFAIDVDRWRIALRRGYDLAVLVNPNNPTGAHVRREVLESVLASCPTVPVWVDEAYLDYVDPAQSLERFAARSAHVVVCKSLSKVYALSGARAAYLCGPRRLIAPLRRRTPPWAVSLPAQVAAVAALRDTTYYARRYAETHLMRARLAAALRDDIGCTVRESAANWVLCTLPAGAPPSQVVVARCRAARLYVRDTVAWGPSLGARTLRLAVKDDLTNERMVRLLRSASGERPHHVSAAPRRNSRGASRARRVGE